MRFSVSPNHAVLANAARKQRALRVPQPSRPCVLRRAEAALSPAPGPAGDPQVAGAAAAAVRPGGSLTSEPERRSPGALRCPRGVQAALRSVAPLSSAPVPGPKSHSHPAAAAASFSAQGSALTHSDPAPSGS